MNFNANHIFFRGICGTYSFFISYPNNPISSSGSGNRSSTTVAAKLELSHFSSLQNCYQIFASLPLSQATDKKQGYECWPIANQEFRLQQRGDGYMLYCNMH